VKDYVRIARARLRVVFVPLVHLPGHAQVDFGECVGVIGGVRMKLHVFCLDPSQSDACFSGSCHFLRGVGGDSSTVEQRDLTPLILVRIQVPQLCTSLI
jgi:hypothetical protein